jgi:hypothetical protein
MTMEITTPPPGEWSDDHPIVVTGIGPSRQLKWQTATYDGVHWTDPEQVGEYADPGDPTHLPAPPKATQLPARPPRPGRP